MIKEKSWREFRESGLLWWVNMLLHTVGWSIVCKVDKTGEITRVYPGRVRFRGFSEDENTEGYKKISKLMLMCLNPEASDKFEVGKEYYVDFTPAN